MAAGDITYDTGSPRSGGSMFVLTGTMEVDDTYRTFALLPTAHHIISCVLYPKDGVGQYEIDLNVNSSATATQGSVAAFGNHDVQTYHYRCEYV